MSFCYNTEEMPLELHSCSHQLAYGKIVLLGITSLQVAEPINDVYRGLTGYATPRMTSIPECLKPEAKTKLLIYFSSHLLSQWSSPQEMAPPPKSDPYSLFLPDIWFISKSYWITCKASPKSIRCLHTHHCLIPDPSVSQQWSPTVAMAPWKAEWPL